MANNVDAIGAIFFLNLCLYQRYKKAHKRQKEEGFFHEQKLFVCEWSFSGVLNEVKKKVLRFFKFFLGLHFSIFESGYFFICKIETLPINVVVDDMACGLTGLFRRSSSYGFKDNRYRLVHNFSFFLLL